MPVPIGDSSAFFYYCKLNCYNFTISDIKTSTTKCFFWHEGFGHTGATEIGSCVFIYLQMVETKYPNSNVIFISTIVVANEKTGKLYNFIKIKSHLSCQGHNIQSHNTLCTSSNLFIFCFRFLLTYVLACCCYTINTIKHKFLIRGSYPE